MVWKFKSREQLLAVYMILNMCILTLLSIAFWNASILAMGMLGTCMLLPFIRDLDSKMHKVLRAATIIMFIWLLLQYFGLLDKFDKPYFGGDDEIFEKYGEILYRTDAYTISDCPSFGYSVDKAIGFMLIMAWIMRISSTLGGYHTLTPRLLNIYMWLAVAVMAYQLIKKSDAEPNEKMLRRITLGLMIFPNAMFVNSCVYRDTLSIFLLFLCVYFTDKITEKSLIKKLTNLLPVCLVYAVSIYVLYYVRSDLLIALAALVGIQIFWDDASKLKFMKKLFLIILALATGGVYAFDRVNTMLRDYNNYLLYERNAVNGMSGRIFSTPILPFGIILRFIWGQLQPFPGEIFTQDFYGSFMYAFVQILVHLGTILQVCYLPYIFKSAIKLNSDAMKYLLVYMMVIVTTFGFRHFLMVYPFAAIELYYGIKNVSRYKIRSNTFAILCLCGLAGFVYLLIL